MWGGDGVGMVVGMARTADGDVLWDFVAITVVIYASLGISGKGGGDGGDEMAKYLQLLLVCTHCFIRKEGGPIERNVAFHPHHPHHLLSY